MSIRREYGDGTVVTPSHPGTVEQFQSVDGAATWREGVFLDLGSLKTWNPAGAVSRQWLSSYSQEQEQALLGLIFLEGAKLVFHGTTKSKGYGSKKV